MKIRKADDVPPNPVVVEGARDVKIRLLIHEAEGAPNFYMRQFTIAADGHTCEHAHDWEHECYILAGSGTVVTSDGEKPISAGDCIYVAPQDNHQFRNAGQGELELLCLIPKPREPLGGEKTASG